MICVAARASTSGLSLRPRFGVQRASRSICARLTSDQCSGVPSSLIVVFWAVFSRGGACRSSGQSQVAAVVQQGIEAVEPALHRPGPGQHLPRDSQIVRV
jgi:hypothetical protein